MIQSITVINDKAEELVLDLFHPELSGIQVLSVDGLGPTKSDINIENYTVLDGGFFTSAHAGIRNIVLHLGLMFDPTVEINRQKTYRYFPIKKKVTIRVKTDQHTLETSGYVESNEPDIFSDRETTQISVVCPDPYMYEESRTRDAYLGVGAKFEFPFSNESLSEPMIEFGEIRTEPSTIVNYIGDSDTGMEIRIHATDVISGVTIHDIDTHGKIAFDDARIKEITGSGIIALDDIIVSTIPGAKSVFLLRNGKYYNIISAIAMDTEWFKLSPGDNEFAFTAEKGERNLVVTFTYRNAFGGV